MNKLGFLLLFIIFLGACKKSIQEPIANTKKPELSVVKKYASVTQLDNYSKNYVKDWKEYNDLTDFFKRFENISANEALNNAIELRDLIKSVKDSIKPKLIDNNAFNARVNVLENETLRLVDMSKIPSIKANEVNLQVSKVFSVFNSVNEKIITIYSQKRFEEAVNVDGAFTFLDTVKSKQQIFKQNKKKPKKEILIDDDFFKNQKKLLKEQEKLIDQENSEKGSFHKKNTP